MPGISPNCLESLRTSFTNDLTISNLHQRQSEFTISADHFGVCVMADESREEPLPVFYSHCVGSQGVRKPVQNYKRCLRVGSGAAVNTNFHLILGHIAHFCEGSQDILLDRVIWI